MKYFHPIVQKLRCTMIILPLDLGRNFLRWLRVLDILFIPNRGVEQPGSSSGS